MTLKKLIAKATPLPWRIVRDARKKLMSAILGSNDRLVFGSLICNQRDQQAIIDHQLAVHAVKMLPQLVDALKDLLAQQEGPAGVWGDGRGRDGKKTGLSGQEFNALRDKRIKTARAVLKEANDPEVPR